MPPMVSAMEKQRKDEMAKALQRPSQCSSSPNTLAPPKMEVAASTTVNGTMMAAGCTLPQYATWATMVVSSNGSTISQLRMKFQPMANPHCGLTKRTE